jgi:2,3-bisphosphoglycerate-dependent phosphoglycerate mutase
MHRNRHGESEWNKENRFTGWYDVQLSEKGIAEAKEGGRLLKEAGFTFDKAYTSVLRRAIKTCWLVLEEMDLMWIPVEKAWQLNERHYGALQGLDKNETVAKHGKDQVHIWRRSYDIPPPPLEKNNPHYPGNDVRYGQLLQRETPVTESLKTTLDRVVPFWEKVIKPDVTAGKGLLIAAHGNSLRALVKKLDNIPDSDITELNIPTGTPLVYELDSEFKPIKHKESIGPLSGRYLGNQEAIKARILGVKNQTK